MFAVKFTVAVYKTIQGFGDFYGPLDGGFIWHRQCARMSQTNFTNIGVGRVPIRIIFAGTKHLALGFELGMYL